MTLIASDILPVGVLPAIEAWVNKFNAADAGNQLELVGATHDLDFDTNVGGQPIAHLRSADGEDKYLAATNPEAETTALEFKLIDPGAASYLHPSDFFPAR